jgi:hypothetical protein
VAEAVGEQRLDQALAFGIVGDHRRMARVGRVNESRDAALTPVVAHRHGAQIKANHVGRREFRSVLAVNLDFLLDEPEVLRKQFRPLSRQRRRHAHTRGA